MPIPTSNANFRRNPSAYLAPLFLGLGLTAAAMFVGLIFWRLVHLPHSSHHPAAAKHREAAPVEPAEPQPVIVIDGRRKTEEPIEDTSVALRDSPQHLQQHESKPKAAIVAVSPPLPEPPTADQIFEQRLQASEDDLLHQLAAVPELRLLNDAAVQNVRQVQRNAQRNLPRIAHAEEHAENEFARANHLRGRVHVSKADITAVQNQMSYEVSRNLHEQMTRAARHDGLRLQFGSKSKLPDATAAEMAELSKSLRELGFVTVPGMAATKPFSAINRAEAAELASQKIKIFQFWCDRHHLEMHKGTMPTLIQMLQIENEATRLLLVRELRRIRRHGATTQLAGRAIMDLSPQVRQAAVAGLEGRAAEEYVPILLRGLRYPWPPIADHAAAALRALKPTEAVASLVAMLDLPSPSTPLHDADTNQYTVREMVRLNHLRNCLLCHEPSLNQDDGPVRGLVPVPGSPMPRPTASRPSYYEGTGDFVRADITYLHQDFSVTLPDRDARPWPREQRFDFVTRVRTVSPNEIAERPTAIENYPQRDAVLYALRGLTGKDGGTSSRRWRELLGLSAANPKRETTRPALENIAVIPIERNH